MTADYRKAETPAYIFDLDKLRERVRLMREVLGGGIRLVYAVKANPFLAEPLLPLVDAFEVCSPGEERITKKLGIPSSALVLSGVNKEDGDIAGYVRSHGADAVYTIESPLQAERINQHALRSKLRIRVLLRLSSGNQFGMDCQTIAELIKNRGDYPGLLFGGLQYYSGTQKREKQILSEIEMLDERMAALTKDGSLPAEEGLMRELEFGPGLPVPYFLSDGEEDAAARLGRVRDALSGMHFTGRISLELGRFIAADCGTYLTKVMDLKENDGAGYCIVDGGIHQVNYYGQMMGMKRPRVTVLKGQESGGSGQEAHWTVCGSLCTTGDVLMRDFPASGLACGDILAFEKAGAYSVTEGISLFLSRDLPRVYIKSGGELTLVRDKILTEEWNYGRNTAHS